jgi:hypothetical protein
MADKPPPQIRNLELSHSFKAEAREAAQIRKMKKRYKELIKKASTRPHN